MKKLLILLIIWIPAVGFAKPATEPTAENSALISRAFDVTVVRYDEYNTTDIPWDHEMLPYVQFFNARNATNIQGTQDLNSEITKAGIITLFTAIAEDMDDRSFGSYEHDLEQSLRAMEVLPIDATCEEILQVETPFALPSHCKAGGVLKAMYSWLPYDYVYPQVEFKKEYKVTMDEDVVYYNEEPIKGIFVNWSVKPYFKNDFIEDEILKMKEMGVVGISTEIGWDEIEQTEDEYRFPRYFDQVLDTAEDNGLYVNILLSGHYTPGWVMRKYGDIKMYTVEGYPVLDGSYMTFSPTSPAINDLKEFQAHAIQHYSDYPNVIAFFLSNEQSYGNKAQLDYSDWAKQAWRTYREEQGMTPFEYHMPTNDTDPEFVNWQKFRQDMLLNYLNELYDNAVQARDRFIPIGHKTIFYEATSAYSRDYGIYPAATALDQDIVGADIYGYTPNVYPAQNAFRKPIFVIETNLPYDWGADPMYEYLVMQYYQRLPVQTIFQWNEGTHPNVMFYPGGAWWKKTHGIARAIDFINSAEIPEYDRPNTAVVLPRNALAKDGHLFEVFQYVFDDVLWELEKNPDKHPIIIWSDEIPEYRYTNEFNALLAGIEEIVIITSPIDHVMDRKGLITWIENGGVVTIK